MYSRTLKYLNLGSVVAFAACSDSGSPPTGATTNPIVPSLISAVAGVPPENVLAVKVAFDATGADSVHVTYQTGATVDATPFHTAVAGTDTIVVLGLRPSTSYQVIVEAITHGMNRSSTPMTVQTDVLPNDIATASLQRLAGVSTRPYAATGVLAGTGGYAIIFDTSGTVVWYRAFTGTGVPVQDLAQQPNGNFTAFIGASHGWEPANGYYVEFTPRGDIVRTYEAPGGYWVDGHEIVITGSGASTRAHYLTYDRRDMDLSPYSGPSSAIVAGHQLVRADATGKIEWAWNSWDYLAFTDKVGEEAPQDLANTDYDHPNSIAFDQSGNYVVSWRDLNQVTAINPTTGAILWKIGGVRGQYRFINDPRNGFSKQHYARILPNGNLLLFDNGFDISPQESRAVEYKLDHTAKTATMVWEYKHVPALFSMFVGNANRLSNGNTWVGFGLVGRVTEVSATGAVVWDAQLKLGNGNSTAYRIVPVASLYKYVAP